jgi:hypothetical protein
MSGLLTALHMLPLDVELLAFAGPQVGAEGSARSPGTASGQLARTTTDPRREVANYDRTLQQQ